MSHIVLRNFTKRTFALLLGNVSIGKLIEKLDLYINDHPIRGLQTSFEHLKNGCVSLLTCCEKLGEAKTEELFVDEKSELGKQTCSDRDVSKSEISCTSNAQAQFQLTDKEKQPNDSKDYERSLSSPSHARLQKELQLIKESDQFKKAAIYFKKANDSLKGIFKDKDKTQNDLIITTKVLIISEILGDLTNLTDAIETCEQHILKLHESLNAHSDMTVIFQFVMAINMKVFNYMREFTGKPVVMLDWPMIHGEKQKKFHPILGGSPERISNPPDIDPFTHFTDASKNKVEINSCIAAINCSGEIFARAKASSDILRVTSNCENWYSFDNDRLGKSINIGSIAIDCTDCKTSEDSKVGETSTQCNVVNPGLPGIVCHGKMYILAWGIFEGNFRFFLYVISMEGTKEHEEELGFLERIQSPTGPKVKIFCIDNKRVVVLDVSRRVIHICDNKGMEKHTIDVTVYLNKINAFRPPIFTCNGEFICLVSTLNFFSKINVYDIVIGEDSTVEKTKPEINVQRAVRAAAFNHKLNEIIILCYNFSLEYHLMTYSKEDGKLIEDIRLHHCTYKDAGLIFNSQGPIALLDDFKLLRLK